MKQTLISDSRRRNSRSALMQLLAGAILCAGLEGCVVVGGTSRGGFFLWPGGLGLVVMIALLVLLLRRR